MHELVPLLRERLVRAGQVTTATLLQFLNHGLSALARPRRADLVVVLVRVVEGEPHDELCQVGLQPGGSNYKQPK